MPVSPVYIYYSEIDKSIEPEPSKTPDLEVVDLRLLPYYSSTQVRMIDISTN